MPTLLLVSASPIDQDRLRLGAETRDIRNALQRSVNRESWTIQSNEAVTVDDLRRALLDFRPTVVHFSGHGGGAGGLCFEDANGQTHVTDGAPLAKLFHIFKDSLKCVVLNACYSDVQGEVISREIDYTIGMRSAVDDSSACKFAVAFYDAVFAGTDFRTAFDLGCTALDLNKLPGGDAPVFITGSHLAPKVLSYSTHIPEIERVLYSYFNTQFHERHTFTTTGESLQPVMVRHYGEQMHHEVKKLRVTSMKAVTDDQWRIEIQGGESRLMYVRIRDRSVMVEWEASVGLWSVPVQTYLALPSNEPVVARVHAELGTHYLYEFTDQQRRFQAIDLRPEHHRPLQGYVKRNTDVYRDLMAILSDGNSHSITVEIVNVTKHTDMPLIQKVLSSTWLYSLPPEGLPTSESS